MRALKNIAILFCLLTVSASFGMLRKIQSMRDQNPIGFYSNKKMIQALKSNNRTRIDALLERAAWYTNLFKKSPIRPKVINAVIYNTDLNILETLKLLLDNNAPIDARAVPNAIELNKMGLLEPGEIKNIIEFLLEHNAPLDERAFEKALEWQSYELFEPLLQHGAPISDVALERTVKECRDTTLTLFVKYNPDMYEKILPEVFGYSVSNDFKDKAILYVDSTTLINLTYWDVPEWIHIFKYWLVEQNASLEKIPTSKEEDSTYTFALTLLHMPRITLPYDFSHVLANLPSEAIEALMNDVAEGAENEINQKAFESLLTFLVSKNDETTIKEHYFHHTTNTEFFKKPIICAKVLSALRKQRMDDKFMHHAMQHNTHFTFK